MDLRYFLLVNEEFTISFVVKNRIMLFADIIGHSDLKEKLVASVKNNRISHALLFLGNDGTGNLPLAVAFAQYLNCTQKGEKDSCGSCNSCIKFDKLIHPDMHLSFPIIGEKGVSAVYVKEFRKAFAQMPYFNYQDWMAFIESENKQGNITALECRDIISKLSLAAFEGEYKILLMWKPEFLRKEGNILLKIIEEPPPKTVFLFVASQADQILTTILSRTQLIRVPPIDAEAIEKALINRYQLPESEAMSISVMAEGSFREAMILANESTSSNEELFAEWMRICYMRNAKDTVHWIDANAGMGRERLKSFFAYGLHVIRDCFLNRYGSQQLLRVHNSQRGFIDKFSVFIHEKNLPHFTKLFDQSIFYVERNGNAKLILMNMALETGRLLHIPLPKAKTKV